MEYKNFLKGFGMALLIVSLISAYWIFVEYWWHYFFVIGFGLIGYVSMSWAGK